MSAYIDLTLFATTFATLFVIMDPPGAVPVFLALTSTMREKDRSRAALQATVTSLGVIIAFAVVGRYILQFLQISVPALQLSGGVLLFLVAMELLTSDDAADSHSSMSDVSTVALVPLGTPLLAGPGAIVAVMVAVQNGGGTFTGWTAVLGAIFLMHIVMWLTMRFASGVRWVLGEGGTLLLTKIAGLLLAAIATEMIASAVFAFINLNAA